MTDREGLRIEPVRTGSFDDLGKLLCTDDAACGCWSMWFITSVREYHAAGIEGNRARFAALAASSDDPRLCQISGHRSTRRRDCRGTNPSLRRSHLRDQRSPAVEEELPLLRQ